MSFIRISLMPKVALFYDWLNQYGGAEKVLLSLLRLYPDAPVYTLVYDPQKTPWLPPQTKVITSFINRLPFSRNNPLIYTPLYDLALEQFDFSDYDIVISTTSVVGHSLITPPHTLFICYYHNLNRYLYFTPAKYSFLKPLLKIYQKIDAIYARRPDHSFCNSQTVKTRLANKLHLQAQVICPGIDVNYFQPIASPSQDYFLLVSRLVPHKNIDLVIKAFRNLPYKLIIVGTGRELANLKSLAKNNPRISFAGSVSSSRLLGLYQNCQAVLCPQLEDFGLVALEAQSCGRPVIGLNQGGNTETVINGQTGYLFSKPTIGAISTAVSEFSAKKYDPALCRQNALRFSEDQFMLNFKKAVDTLWKEH